MRVSLSAASKADRGWCSVGAPYVENALGRSPAGLIVPLGQRYQLLGQPLRLLCLCVCCLDVFVLHELRDEAAQQGLARRRVAAQVPVLDEAASHCACGEGFSRSTDGGEERELSCLGVELTWVVASFKVSSSSRGSETGIGRCGCGNFWRSPQPQPQCSPAACFLSRGPAKLTRRFRPTTSILTQPFPFATHSN